MQRIVTGSFEDFAGAARGASALVAAGFGHGDVSHHRLPPLPAAPAGAALVAGALGAMIGRQRSRGLPRPRRCSPSPHRSARSPARASGRCAAMLVDLRPRGAPRGPRRRRPFARGRVEAILASGATSIGARPRSRVARSSYPLIARWTVADLFRSTSRWETLVRGSAVYLSLFVIFRFIVRPRHRQRRHRRSPGAGARRRLPHRTPWRAGYTTITDGLILVLTLIFWNVPVRLARVRFPAVRAILQGPPVRLIQNGRYLRRNMRRELVTVGELEAKLRGEDRGRPRRRESHARERRPRFRGARASAAAAAAAKGR
jgi:hypothetical protein